jgi:trans-aconitate methyltransferase
MNDITKARAFLSATESDLQYLVSFGLMLATAEQKYRDLQLQRQGHKDVAGSLDEKEIDVVLDVAVLRYLKRNNQLPRNITDAFAPGTTLDRKKELALSWING